MGRKPKTERQVVKPRLEVWCEIQLAELRPTGEIIDAALVEFGCAESTVHAALASVRAKWNDSSRETLEERRAFFLHRLNRMWRLALAGGDYRAVAQIARTYADVDGLRAPRKLEHSGEIGLRPVAAMSPAERRAEIAMLQAKMLAADNVVNQDVAGAIAASAGAIVVDDEEREDDEEDEQLEDPN